MSALTLHSGRTLTNVHPDGACLGEFCCIHKPSDHPLKDAPLDWYGEVKHMVRVCEHGIHHPDPDDVQFKMSMWDWATVEAISSVHIDRCDGCCR